MWLNSHRVDGPSFRELEPADDLYPLAAWAHHHARFLPASARRGLFIALERAWPRTQGDTKDAETRALKAAWLAAHGKSAQDIAEVFCVTPDYARRLVRKGEQVYRSPKLFPHPENWTVEASTDDPSAAPEDPAGMLAWMRLRAEDELKAAGADEARAQSALSDVA